MYRIKNYSNVTALANSVIRKTIGWIGILYAFNLLHAPQNNYISKQTSDAVGSCFVSVLMGLFVVTGLYITIVLMFGNENDIENICHFVLENHIALMVSILIVKR